MVLEHLFSEKFLEKRIRYVFLIALIYSTMGIIGARLLFGSNSGIVSVIFTSILLLPSLSKIFEEEEEKEEKEKKFNLKHLWLDNKDAIKVYFAMFFGVFFTYLLYSFLLPQIGINVFNIFKEQLFIDPGLRGHAFSTDTFVSILANNWWVLIACFLLALLTGDGAIFFITWNASAWGTIFGYRALSAANYSGANPWWYLFIILIIVMWHVIIEAAAYIIAAISGSIISDDVIKKSNQIENFIFYFIVGGTFIGILLSLISPLTSLPLIFIAIIIFLIGLFLMKNVFIDKSHKEVFTYNFWLFIIAIVIFIIGALVETGVLSYSGLLMKIYSYSHLF